GAAGAAVLVLASLAARGDAPVPPWVEGGDLPPPSWARSVAAHPDDLGRPGDLTLYAGPNRAAGRRGVTLSGATLPFFGEKRGSGCSGRWLLVGALAWACSDDADLSPAPPETPPEAVEVNGLSLR